MDRANSYTFRISTEGYEGSFIVHRPTVGDLEKIELIKSRELGNLKNVSKAASSLTHMLSVLEVVVDSSPKWWKPRDLEDVGIIQDVYEKYEDYLQKFNDELDLKEEAKENVNTIAFWFRWKYKLSPKDPRYLECEPWEIELEYEIEKLRTEKSPITPLVCPKCGQQYLGNECQSCGHKSKVERYFDPDFDEYFDKVEKENEEYFSKPIKWEEVEDDSGIGET